LHKPVSSSHSSQLAEQFELASVLFAIGFTGNTGTIGGKIAPAGTKMVDESEPSDTSYDYSFLHCALFLLKYSRPNYKYWEELAKALTVSN
jgi:hypothetical protein